MIYRIFNKNGLLYFQQFAQLVRGHQFRKR